MERRKAVTVAATASLTLLAGAGGIALSSGILSASGDDGVGRISPLNGTVTPQVSAATPRVTVYVDEPASTAVPSTAPVPSSAPVAPTDSPPVTTSSASSYGGGSEADDEDGFDDGGNEDGYEEEHEYEGADDDD